VESIPQAEIQAHVARIGASSAFANSARLRGLLQHTVAESLAGRNESLKESVLGVTVFGRKPGYDSDANSIVQFGRLRKKLEQYYEADGANEKLRSFSPGEAMLPDSGVWIILPTRASREGWLCCHLRTWAPMLTTSAWRTD
jgi:hypothetical protein